METREQTPNLAKAVIAVMKAVKGIDKSMTVGSGTMSYKGVPDQEVKKIIGEAMEKNGLCILPIGVDAKAQVDRWEENTTYNGQTQVKMKQSVFTEATTTYLLLHESGESQILQGYGQGVDSQDKSAGKASTYALKYTLLYTFLVPTGKIDDADTTHSDSIETPQKRKPIQVPEPSVAEKASQMGKSVPQLTEKELNEYKIKIDAITQPTGLTGFYNSLTADVQANPSIIQWLKDKRESFKVKA